MTRRTSIRGLVAALALAWGSWAWGQAVGLQVADTAEVRTAGETEFTLGAAFSDPMASCAARAMYSLQDEFRVFFDLGWTEPENDDGNIAVQAGGIYALGIDFLSDLGIRMAGYYVDTDTTDITGGNAMLLSSGETFLDDLFVYAGAGADVSEREISTARGGDSSRGEINYALTAGALYRVTTHLSAYVEASHIDGPMVGFGLRYR